MYMRERERKSPNTHTSFNLLQACAFQKLLLLSHIHTNVNAHWHDHMDTCAITQTEQQVGAGRPTHKREWGVDLQHVCEYCRSQGSFPRNPWHKLPLSHYLMTKHSHNPPPMPLLNFTLWAAAVEKTVMDTRVWRACTSAKKLPLFFFKSSKSELLASQLSAKFLEVRWLQPHLYEWCKEKWRSHHSLFSSSKHSALNGSFVHLTCQYPFMKAPLCRSVKEWWKCRLPINPE